MLLGTHQQHVIQPVVELFCVVSFDSIKNLIPVSSVASRDCNHLARRVGPLHSLQTDCTSLMVLFVLAF